MRENKGKPLVEFFTMRKKDILIKGKNSYPNFHEIFFGLIRHQNK
jgi:hypothetical protein